MTRICTRKHTYAGSDPCPVCYPDYRRYVLKAKVWLYPGDTACWHFLTLPKKESEEMQKRFGTAKRGWGSLPVTVTIGKTSWNTSVFPDKKSGAYILPLKAKVRKDERIGVGDIVNFTVVVRL